MTKDVVTVDTPSVACDGNGSVSGHPRVSLTFTPPSREVVCPYCSRTFVLAAGASADHGH